MCSTPGLNKVQMALSGFPTDLNLIARPKLCMLTGNTIPGSLF